MNLTYRDKNDQKRQLDSISKDLEMESSNRTIPERIPFSAANYSVFGCMLALSALIGIYYGFISKKKQNTTVEYLLGGKQMNSFPIAASLIASHLSGATFLAVPAEVYANGAAYVLSTISAILVSANENRKKIFTDFFPFSSDLS